MPKLPIHDNKHEFHLKHHTILNPHPERSSQENFVEKLTGSKLQQGLAKFNSFFWKKEKENIF
jgi:hypothetical protein